VSVKPLNNKKMVAKRKKSFKESSIQSLSSKGLTINKERSSSIHSILTESPILSSDNSSEYSPNKKRPILASLAPVRQITAELNPE